LLRRELPDLKSRLQFYTKSRHNWHEIQDRFCKFPEAPEAFVFVHLPDHPISAFFASPFNLPPGNPGKKYQRIMSDLKPAEERSLNFLEEIIEEDLRSGKHTTILTRFPPEPNGYLHIGHASSICLNFGLAKKYGGKTNLRFDDTNPATEETEYVESIKADVKWLGFEWANELYASNYFPQLHQFAIQLIERGLAYVDDSTSEEIAAQKGTPTHPGQRNQYAERSVEENLRIFQEMKDGKYKDGEKVLRARIDMNSSNMLMRDPLLYRIKHVHHHRTGNDWCIYPMYDFAHGQSDSIENITHSICTLEFAAHRELYDWFIATLGITRRNNTNLPDGTSPTP